MFKLSLIAAASAAVLATTAHADTYRFDVDDPAATLGGQPFENYHFFLESTPIVDSSDSGSFSVATTDYGHTFSDVSVLDEVTFFTTAESGGFENNFSLTFGPQVFSGAPANPSFKLGNYSFDGGETLAITDVSPPPTSPVPEASTWLLMLAGLGVVGAALRVQHKSQGRKLSSRRGFLA